MTTTSKIYSLPLLLFIAGLFIVCAFMMTSCKDQTNQSNTSNIIFPDSNVSYTKQVEPLFQQTCAQAGCHSGDQPAANLDLQIDAWHSLINYLPPLIIVKNGNNSPLVKYLDGRLLPQMPLRSQPLTTNQINGVKKWIDEGARLN